MHSYNARVSSDANTELQRLLYQEVAAEAASRIMSFVHRVPVYPVPPIESLNNCVIQQPFFDKC